MIADLEKNAQEEGKESFKTSRKSNAVVDAIIQQVKKDLDNSMEDERTSLVDAIAAKVKKDLEAAGVDDENIEEQPTEEQAAAYVHGQREVKGVELKKEEGDSPAVDKEKTAANSELADGLGNE